MFSNVRLAPLYDAVTTRVFRRLKRDRLALKLNGKDDRLNRADFLALAATAGLKAADANNAIDSLISCLEKAISTVTLPKLPNLGKEAETMVSEMLDICRGRIETLA